MFNFFSSAFRGTVNFLHETVEVLPAFVSSECERHDITPASVASAAATHGAQALSFTANFAVATAGYLLNLGWNGLTTYGPPLAEAVWTGVKTYGPPAATAFGKATVWTGANTWEAAKWSGNAVATAAEEHHVKERALAAAEELLGGAAKGLALLANKAVEEGLPALAHLNDQAFETGTALLTEAQAGWELLSGKGIDLGPLEDIGIYGAAATELPPQAVPADQGRPVEAIAASSPDTQAHDPLVWHASMLDDLDQEYGPLAAGDLAPDTGQSDVWHTARSHWSQDLEFSPGAMHCHTELHLHVHITGAMPSTCVPFPAG
jgi:hypothetical protein